MNALLLLIFAYGGFEAALFPAGEVKNPAREAPVALMAALVIVTTCIGWCRLWVICMLPNSAPTGRPLSAADIVSWALVQHCSDIRK